MLSCVCVCKVSIGACPQVLHINRGFTKHVVLCLLQACLVAGMLSWLITSAGNPEPVRMCSGVAAASDWVLMQLLARAVLFLTGFVFPQVLKHTALD